MIAYSIYKGIKNRKEKKAAQEAGEYPEEQSIYEQPATQAGPEYGRKEKKKGRKSALGGEGQQGRVGGAYEGRQ